MASLKLLRLTVRRTVEFFDGTSLAWKGRAYTHVVALNHTVFEDRLNVLFISV